MNILRLHFQSYLHGSVNGPSTNAVDVTTPTTASENVK